MAERVVTVKLSARVAEYKQGMLEAAQATRAVGTQAEKLAQTRQAMEQLGRIGLTAGGLIATGLTVAVRKFAEFDQAMSNVAATGEDARANMDRLRQAAIDAGASTVYSATEAANAIEELAKDGLDSAQILGGALAGSLDLAAAGGLGVADAAATMSTTLQQFQLDGSQASHVADLLAAGAGKAMGDVSDMGQALNQAGLVSSQFGISVEETVGTLSAFASAGMLGSDAGTSMRTMLLRLANPTKEVATLMETLGFEAYNSQGEFIGLEGLAGELESSLEGMTQAQRDQTLAMIFGQDAIRGANILLREGADGIRDWTDRVDDQGYAAETAAKRLDNLRGDLEAMQGALDSAMITIGSAADGPLRVLVRAVTDVVDGFNDMPDGAQQAVYWIGAAAAAAALAGGTYMVAIPKIAEYRNAIQQMGPTAQRTSRIVGIAFKGMVAAAVFTTAVAGLNELRDTLRGAEASSTDLANALSRGSLDSALAKAVEGTALPWEVERVTATLQDLRGVLDQVRNGAPSSNSSDPIDIWFDQLKGSVENAGDALATLDTQSAVAAIQRMREEFDLTDENVLTLIKSSGPLHDKLIEVADGLKLNADDATLLDIALGRTTEAFHTGTGAAEDQAVALEELQGVATSTEEDVNSLADAIRDFGSATFDTEEAAIAFHDAFADLDAIMKEGKGSLDVTTEAGRNTVSSLLDAASSTNEYAASVMAMGGSTEEVQGILEAGRQKIIDTRMALGESEEAARLYADQLIATPQTIATQIQVNGANEAWERIQRLKDAIDALPGYKGVSVDTIVGNPSFRSANGNLFDYRRGMQEFADGGFTGPGIYAGRTPGIHKFAEKETIWEAYISGKPGMTERNQKIAKEAVLRLGGVAFFANGGITGARGDVARTTDALASWQERARGARGVVARWEGELEAAKAAEKVVKDTKDVSDESKRAAEAATAAVQAQLDAAKKQLDDVEAKLRSAESAAKSARSEFSSLSERFAEDRAEWSTGLRRGEQQRAGMNGGGLGLVDEAFDLAKNIGGKQGKSLRELALGSEEAFLKLEAAAEKSNERLETARDRANDRNELVAEKAAARVEAVEERAAARREKVAEKAAARVEAVESKAASRVEKIRDKVAGTLDRVRDKLSGLRDSAASMASSVSAAVRQAFDLSAIGAAKTSTEVTRTGTKRTVGGIELTTYEQSEKEVTTPVTAGSVRKDFATAAARIKAFAAKLKKLAGRGINAKLLAEIASLGVDGGTPIADALLSASKDDIASINASYKAIGAGSDQAGATVADANYKALIKAAENQLAQAQKTGLAQIRVAEKEARRQIAAAERSARAQVRAAERIGRAEVASAEKQRRLQIAAAERIGRKEVAEAAKEAKAIRLRLKDETDRIVKAITNGLKTQGKATGGPVYGPGTRTSDSILTRLSNEEHVWSADEVDGFGGHQAMIRARAKARAGTLTPTPRPVLVPGSMIRATPTGRADGAPIDARVIQTLSMPVTAEPGIPVQVQVMRGARRLQQAMQKRRTLG